MTKLKELIAKEDPLLVLSGKKIENMLELAQELLTYAPLKTKGLFDKDYFEFQSIIVEDMILAIKNNAVDQEILLLTEELNSLKNK